MASSSTTAPDAEPKRSGTYEGGCHCGYIKYAATLSPPLPEYKILQCNCSMCTSGGYLLTYPDRKDVKWHNDSRARCAVYRFNTKKKEQLFCPKCGTSIGIDFSDPAKPEEDGYGISARTFYGINLKEQTYKYLDGVNRVSPREDLVGKQWELDEAERKEREAHGKA